MRFTRPHPIAAIRRRFEKPERSTAQYEALLAEYEAGHLTGSESTIAAVALQVFGFNLRLERKMRRQRLENRFLYALAVLLSCSGLWQLKEIDSTRSDNAEQIRQSQIAGCDRNNKLRERVGLGRVICTREYPRIED